MGVEGLDPMGGEGASEVKQQADQGKGISTTRMSVGGVGVWDISHEIVPRIPTEPKP